MSYTKREWATGNIVGAVDLNRIEDRIANIDAGYSCTEEYTLLTDESVTTAQDEYGYITGTLAYSTLIDADTVKVTFNGVEYICENRNHSPLNNNVYGAPYNDDTESYDWSEYPFFLIGVKSDGTNVLGTETAGTYQVKIEALEMSVTTTPCFEKAVESVSGASGGSTEPLIVTVNTKPNTWSTLSSSWQEIHDAYVEGRTVLFQEVEVAFPTIAKKDFFGSVVGVKGNDTGMYYVYVYVGGQMRQFSTNSPDSVLTYSGGTPVSQFLQTPML